MAPALARRSGAHFVRQARLAQDSLAENEPHHQLDKLLHDPFLRAIAKLERLDLLKKHWQIKLLGDYRLIKICGTVVELMAVISIFLVFLLLSTNKSHAPNKSPSPIPLA